jgi:serine/threonine protein kinase
VRDPSGDEPSLVGTTVGRYRILERIGEGGMGVVFRAEQEGLGRVVALKLIHKGLAAEPEIVSRFLREARIAGSLTNPNTVTIYDFGKADDGSLYLAMEFIEGESLKRRLERDGTIPPTEAAAIGIQVCRSLLEAHKKDIVHRDLKPENILLSVTEDGTQRVKVLDYGLARSVNPSETGAAAQVTQAGIILGTPEYMSPEQAQGFPVDIRSDIYSLGIVLYEMLSGATPFSGDSNISLLASHVVQAPPLMEEVGRRLAPPPELERLVGRMMAKEPEDRPADALEVLRTLKAYLLGQQPAALSQVFLDPAAADEAEDDAATQTRTPALPETTLDDSASEPAIAVMPPPFEGDRTLVDEQAFPDDEDEAPAVTAPRARVPSTVLVDDALTAPATPALLGRRARIADDLEPPTVDSSVTTPDDPVPGPPFGDFDASRPSRPRSDPGTGQRPSGPRVTQQIPGRGEPPRRSFQSEDAAHVELGSRIHADAVDLATAVTVPPEPAPPESAGAPPPRRVRAPERPTDADRAARQVSSRRAATEVLVVAPRRAGAVQLAIVAGLAVLVGIAITLWWTRSRPSAEADEGLPAGTTAAMPPAEGWSGSYDTSRGPLLLDQQGGSLAGSLGVGNDAVRLAGQVEGMTFRFAWARGDTGGPITAQGSGRGEARWYVTADGQQLLRATLGYGTVSVGAGAFWATRRR